MFSKETKILIIWAVIGMITLALPRFIMAQSSSSTDFTVNNPVVDSGAQNSSSSSFGLGQSFTQIAIGKSASTDFQLWSGFQYFFKVNANTLTPTPGDTQVALSWTVPQTFLGIAVGNYEVGTGTVSGSYVFQSVGNVTNFTKTGLTNGTPYFFIIKAETAAGEFLVYSNEATATPNGTVTNPTGGSGGANSGTLNVSGQAYPGAAVTLVENSTSTSNTIADSTGKFQFSLNTLVPGDYNFIVYATDTVGTKSANLNFQATIQSTVTTTVNNLIIAPTITTDQSTVKQGDDINISGSAAPGTSVSIRVNVQTQKGYQAQAGADGKYNYKLNTAGMDLADYTAIANYAFGTIASPDSLPAAFTVGERTIPKGPQVCGGRSDLNCDGKVNLVDFSILLYFWDGSGDLSINPRADIDHSGIVDLKDFSIMLFDWTG